MRIERSTSQVSDPHCHSSTKRQLRTLQRSRPATPVPSAAYSPHGLFSVVDTRWYCCPHIAPKHNCKLRQICDASHPINLFTNSNNRDTVNDLVALCALQTMGVNTVATALERRLRRARRRFREARLSGKLSVHPAVKLTIIAMLIALTIGLVVYALKQDTARQNPLPASADFHASSSMMSPASVSLA